MAKLIDMIAKINGLDLWQIGADTLSAHVEEIAAMNRQQLMEGVGSDGQPLNPSYAWNDYAQMKQQMNPLPGLGNPDLKLTGAFHASIKYEVKDKELISKANDIHGLEAKYTNAYQSPLKISKDFRTLLIQYYLRETFKKNVQNAINKNA